MAYYADTSALVKLVVAEAESAALRDWIEDSTPVLVSSDLARTELLRAVRRFAPDRATLARSVLDVLILVSVPRSTFDAAGHLDPTSMRSLDAIHLASALELGDDLQGIITYDDRMAEAARLHGITVLAPA